MKLVGRWKIAALAAIAFGIASVTVAAFFDRRSQRGGEPIEAPTLDRPSAPPTASNAAPERTLAGLGKKIPIYLRRGDYLHVEVAQQGADVTLALEDSSGRKKLEIDSPNGEQGKEWLDFIALESGEHHVAVHRLGGRGSFEILRCEQRSPKQRDRSRAAATQLSSEGLEALKQRKPNDESLLARAATQWLQIPNARDEQLAALQRWASASTRQGQDKKALEILDRAAILARTFQDFRAGARIANLRAGVLNGQRDYQGILTSAGEALELARRCEDFPAAAVALGNLAIGYQGIGDYQAALSKFEESLANWRELGRMNSVGIQKHNIGALFNATARWPEAVQAFEDSLALLDPEQNANTVAAARLGLAQAYFQLGKPGWEAELESALAIFRKLGDRAGEARALDRLACMLADKGDTSRAEAFFEQALELYKNLERPVSEAYTTANLGWMELRRARPAEATACFASALPVFEKAGDRVGQGFVLLGLAQAERQLGNLKAALDTSSQAIDLIELQRGWVPESSWRMEFFAPRLAYFDTYIDIAMELHRLTPELGHDLKALMASERGRSRSLLDSLKKRHQIAAPDLVLRSYAEIRPLLEPGTTYLIYYFSSDHAYLWQISADRQKTFDLGPSEEIQEAIVATYQLLKTNGSNGLRIRPAAASLAAKLLPDTNFGDSSRLVVVGDGPVRYVPFALLPEKEEGRPLVERYEIAYEASLSACRALRQLPPRKNQLRHDLAVVADPVLDSSSQAPERLASSDALTRTLRTFGLNQIPSLPFARDEAEEILALAPPRDRLAMLRFAARRELLLAGALSHFRLVHFATHGYIDPDNVQGSGLVLSRFDLEGNPIEPLLAFPDIEQLRLTAELVVASACETAAGRDLRGEGPVGVSYAFLAAGARSAIGTLWRVEDRSTAEFMTVLYRAILVDGLHPAAALRAAQRQVLAGQNDRAKPDWAAFVLLGDFG